jgi:TRAP-type C4-dicarboxylate transport system permease small subunit
VATFSEKVFSFVDSLSFLSVFIAAISITLIMCIEVVNAVGRKFGAPLPCTLEMAESLMISCIFFAAPRVAAMEDHTYVTIITRRLPGYVTRSMDWFGNLIGAFVVGIMGAGAWNIALHSTLQLEMRIGVFRFPIWPFRILFALGLSLLAVQFLMNSFRCICDIKHRRYKVD